MDHQDNQNAACPNVSSPETTVNSDKLEFARHRSVTCVHVSRSLVVAECFDPSQSTRQGAMGSPPTSPEPLASPTPCSPSLSRMRKRARTDLCGGRREIGAPTATKWTLPSTSSITRNQTFYSFCWTEFSTLPRSRLRSWCSLFSVQACFNFQVRQARRAIDGLYC